jgi:hypothetical protein
MYLCVTLNRVVLFCSHADLLALHKHSWPGLPYKSVEYRQIHFRTG